MPGATRRQRRKSRRQPKTRLGRFVRNWVLPILVAVAILTPIRSSVADWNDVPTGSMRPTIMEGDRIFVNKLAYGLRVPFTRSWVTRWGEPLRGDIVTMASPDDGTQLVKRVIAVAGDRVSMKANELYINGNKLGYSMVKPYMRQPLPDGRVGDAVVLRELLPGRSHDIAITRGVMSLNTFDDVTVPDGYCLVLGDNRDLSQDSRVFGLVPVSAVYGRTLAVALSVDPENFYLPRLDRWFISVD